MATTRREALNSRIGLRTGVILSHEHLITPIEDRIWVRREGLKNRDEKK